MVKFSNVILAKCNNFKEVDNDNRTMIFSIFLVSNPKKFPLILNHAFVCSEQNVFFKDERLNKVLIKVLSKLHKTFIKVISWKPLK